MSRVILLLGIVLIGIAVILYTPSQAPAPAKALVLVDPTPTATPILRRSLEEIHSPNGTKKLLLKATGDTYDISVANIDGSGEYHIFQKTVAPGVRLSLPFNAWDPTDTYIFLEEQAGNALTYLVLPASGKGPVIDVGSIWQSKNIPYTIRKATGWASGTLLIVYTTTENGARGPAFWFEIPSTAIIQLAG